MRLSSLAAAGAATFVALAPARPAEAADYDALVATARGLADAGQWQSAAELLFPELGEYPQDFAIHLQAAYYFLRAREWQMAELAYLCALSLSGDSFEARLGLADARIGGGRLAEASSVTERLAHERADDPSVLTRHAFVLFSLGDFAGAERFYEAARTAAPGSADAELGLAWCAQRRGDAEEARSRFAAVLARDPASTSARDGLASLEARHRVFASTWFGAQKHTGNPTRNRQWFGEVGLDALIAERWSAHASYRYLSAVGVAPAGNGWKATRAPVVTQDEVYLSAGHAGAGWGAQVFGAWIATPSAWSASAWSAAVLGAKVNVEPLSPLRIEASAFGSLYDDLDVVQAEVGAVVGVGAGVEFAAGARSQFASSEWFPSVTAELRLRRGDWSVAAGGGYGRQLRPVNMDVLAVYNIPDEPLYGVNVRASFPLVGRVTGAVAYGYERFESAAWGGAIESGAHRAAAGVAVAF